MNTLVTIAILTRNGGALLGEVLASVRSQQMAGSSEILVVDSESTDDTVAVSERLADRVLRVPAQSFNHGATRNLAIEHARGELVVMLVQDAMPTTNTWLAALIEPLLRDPKVAGSFARQVARPEASALARHSLSNWVAASPEPRIVQIARSGDFEALSPIERLRLSAFDNVCSCIRRSVWKAHLFRDTPIAEDLAWGKEVLLAGFRLAYSPAAVVVHSHDRSLGYELARTRDLHDRLYDLFGLQTIPTRRELARAIASSMRLHARLEWESPSRWPRAIGLAVAWPLGQYLGARRALRRQRFSTKGVEACAS